MARTGKIARLPLRIRDELNMRLRDNESGQTILEWVNGLDVTKEQLARHFNGEAISDANLSVWRQGGFAEWLNEQTQIDEVKMLSEFSLRAAKAAGGNLAQGLLAVNAGKIQKALEQFWDGLREVESTEDGNKKDQALTRLLTSLAQIRGLELDTIKTELRKVEVEQKGEVLKLETRKFNHLLVKSFIDWVTDERAKEIATGDMPSEAKIDALGKHLFGEAW